MHNAFGAEFDLEPGYLHTASIGIPPVSVADAVADAVRRWRRGSDGASDFDAPTETAREMFARLVGVAPEHVAVGTAVAQLIGLIAASVPDGSRILVAEREFPSVNFPFAAQRHRGVSVTEVELSELVDRVPEYDLVAVSVVQSADGRRVDLDALRQAARQRPTRVLLDASQAVGWLPLDVAWADWVVSVAYKWLLAHRGVAWLAVHPDAPPIVPQSANWYAADDRSVYGLPLRLADGPRGLDINAAWFAQVAAAHSVSWLAGLDMTQVAEHCLGLANRFRAQLDMAPSDSAIVSVDLPDAVPRLTQAGIRCGARDGKARLAFHLYNTDTDVDLAVRALRD